MAPLRPTIETGRPGTAQIDSGSSDIDAFWRLLHEASPPAASTERLTCEAPVRIARKLREK